MVRAAFTLIVRLRDAPSEPPPGWHDWREAIGDRGGQLRKDQAYAPDQRQPHKQLPNERRQPYFQRHIERALFPGIAAMPAPPYAARWLRQPADERLTIERTTSAGTHTSRLRVDLIERYVPPLTPRIDFGLVHLSLDGIDDWTADSPLSCGSSLRSIRYRSSAPHSLLVYADLDERRSLTGRWLLRQWLDQLFGSSQEGVERTYYVAALAAESDEEGYGEAWCRALARGIHDRERARRDIDQDAGRGRRPRVDLGPYRGFVLGRGCAFGCGPSHLHEGIRNLRSYWADALMLGLVQQTCLEQMAERLGALGGDPSHPDLDAVYDDWLTFRNVIWWSRPSDLDAPTQLLRTLRAELGSEPLFDELAGDMETYMARRQRAVADRQARALADLQAYGAGGTLAATVVALLVFAGVDSGDPLPLVVLVLALPLAVLVLTVLVVRRVTHDPYGPSRSRRG